ncbi:hypothetical protein D039_2788B, partial [Vibrio parahaemolyticus EKP-028]
APWSPKIDNNWR